MLQSVRILFLIFSLFAYITPAFANSAHILVITDFHGAIAGTKHDVGLPRLTTAIHEFKAQHPEAVLVAVGDLFTGTVESNLLKGAPVLEGLLAAGLVCSAVGNHEFDWSADDIPRWTAAGLPFVSANIQTTNGTPPLGIAPYRIMSIGGLRVAFIGLTTTSTPRITNPENVRGLVFTQPTEALRTAVARAKAEGAEAVIVLAHLGASSHNTDWPGGISPAIQALAQIPGVTAVAYGHTHEEHLSRMGNVPIVQPAYRGASLGIISLQRDAQGVTATASLDRLSLRKKTLSEDAAALALVQRAHNALAPMLDIVVGQLDIPAPSLTPDASAPTLLGEIVCDALRLATGADVGIINGGSLRATLDKGPITVRNLYNVLPFENRVMVQEMSGVSVRRALEHGIIAPGDTGIPSRFVQMSGLYAVYDVRKPKGQRIISLTLPDGRPVTGNTRLRVAVNNYLARDGDGYPFLKYGKNKKDTGVSERDVLRNFIETQGTVLPVYKGWLQPHGTDAR